MIFETPEPINLKYTLESGQIFKWEKVNDWYYIITGKRVLKIRHLNGNLPFRLEYYCNSEKEEEESLKSYFRLNDNLETILCDIAKDDFISEITKKYSGLRIIQQDFWECICGFILSQASNIPAIRRNIDQISKRFGDKIEFDGREFHTFPEPEKLREISESELRSLGLGFRSSYLAGIFASHDDIMEMAIKLKKTDYNTAKNILKGIQGVGDKIADCVLLFWGGKLEAFPVDRWVYRTMRDRYFNGKEVALKKVSEFARNYFGRFAGYAQQYIYYSTMEDKKVS
jgi:N-glycosylase/DNA lyase